MRRVLLIGSGEVGAKHAHSLTHTDGMDLMGVADPAPVVAPPAGVLLLTRWETALERHAPDVVVVATPPGTALAAARAAPRGGAGGPAVADGFGGAIWELFETTTRRGMGWRPSRTCCTYTSDRSASTPTNAVGPWPTRATGWATRSSQNSVLAPAGTAGHSGHRTG